MAAQLRFQARDMSNHSYPISCRWLIYIELHTAPHDRIVLQLIYPVYVLRHIVCLKFKLEMMEHADISNVVLRAK